ncbi:hypothetical protein GCM10022381_24730 [Leifsonia kafniensis]|uniref:Fibronectin type-III domain-containing protein n=1 Tax=Leifsonia kafniensis TaxID=475957 RepID=A0ABP7KNI3_9MICO
MTTSTPRPRGIRHRLNVGVGLAVFLILAGTGAAQANWTTAPKTTAGIVTSGALSIAIVPTAIAEHLYTSAATARTVTYPITVTNSSAISVTPSLAFSADAAQTLATGAVGTAAASVTTWTSAGSTCPTPSGATTNWTSATATSAQLAPGASATYCVQSTLSLPQRYALVGQTADLTATATLTRGNWTKTATRSLKQTVANTIIPGTPTANASPGNTQIAIKWTAPADAAGLAGYKIYRDGNATAIRTVAAGTRTFTDTGLLPATTYSYTVRGYVTGTPAAPTNATLFTESPSSGQFDTQTRRRPGGSN